MLNFSVIIFNCIHTPDYEKKSQFLLHYLDVLFWCKVHMELLKHLFSYLLKMNVLVFPCFARDKYQ